MNVVQAYPLSSTMKQQVVRTKPGARFLSVMPALPRSTFPISLYAIVDDERSGTEERDILLVHTGEDLPPLIGPFVGTVVLPSGLTAHVFEGALKR